MNLETKTPKQLLTLWNNAQASIAKGVKVQAAKDLKHAVSMEWKRRAEAGLGYDPEDGVNLLEFLGYHVGTTQGLIATARQGLLDTAMLSTLPPTGDPKLDWGAPGSAKRYTRLHGTLFGRLTRYGGPSLERAKAETLEDIAYLSATYGPKSREGQIPR